VSSFLKWLAGVIARWLQPKEAKVTSSLTTIEVELTSSISTIAAGASALGGEVAAFWKALEAAWNAKGTNIPFDAAAVDDIVILAAQLCTDLSVPGAATVLTIAKLLGGVIPEAPVLIQFITAIAGATDFSVHGAIPGASAADGGYPGSSDNPSWHH
jgi:hypothetical protein